MMDLRVVMVIAILLVGGLVVAARLAWGHEVRPASVVIKPSPSPDPKRVKVMVNGQEVQPGDEVTTPGGSTRVEPTGGGVSVRTRTVNGSSVTTVNGTNVQVRVNSGGSGGRSWSQMSVQSSSSASAGGSSSSSVSSQEVDIIQ